MRHYWAFSSSVLLDRLFLIFLLKISHRFHMGFRSGILAGQSSTVISWSTDHLEGVLTGAKFLLEMEISISTKLQNLLVFGLDKTQWANTSRCHGTQNHPDSGTLTSKLNAKFTFIWKEDFGPLSNSPVLFLCSPGKMLLTLFLFQKWLGSPFP